MRASEQALHCWRVGKVGGCALVSEWVAGCVCLPPPTPQTTNTPLLSDSRQRKNLHGGRVVTGRWVWIGGKQIAVCVGRCVNWLVSPITTPLENCFFLANIRSKKKLGSRFPLLRFVSHHYTEQGISYFNGICHLTMCNAYTPI